MSGTNDAAADRSVERSMTYSREAMVPVDVESLKVPGSAASAATTIAATSTVHGTTAAAAVPHREGEQTVPPATMAPIPKPPPAQDVEANDARYYGGIMKSASDFATPYDAAPAGTFGRSAVSSPAVVPRPAPAPTQPSVSAASTSKTTPLQTSDRMMKSSSRYNHDTKRIGKKYTLYRNMSIQESSTDDVSVDDFEEGDWTPQDSAYGAACPVCGWIPKPVRRGIEFTLIFGMAVFMVYIVVTTSIQVSKDRSDKASNQSTDNYNGGYVQTNDDLYIEDYYNSNSNNNNNGYGDDDYYVDDDDDDAYMAYNNGDDDTNYDDNNNDSGYSYNDDDFYGVGDDRNNDGDDDGGGGGKYQYKNYYNGG